MCLTKKDHLDLVIYVKISFVGNLQLPKKYLYKQNTQTEKFNTPDYTEKPTQIGLRVNQIVFEWSQLNWTLIISQSKEHLPLHNFDACENHLI